jgi:ribosomal protein L15
MRAVLQVLLSLPTGIFTVALAFCLSWWISSFVLGGLGGHGDGGHGGHGGHGHAGHAGDAGHQGHHEVAHSAVSRTGGRAPRSSNKAAGRRGSKRATVNTEVPVSLRWTVAAAIAWSVVLLGSTVVAATNVAGTAKAAVLTVVSLAGIAAGQRTSGGFSRLVGPMFVASEAPDRATLVGSHARVRSLEITAKSGEAKVIDGRSAGAIVRVRIVETQTEFQHGDVVQLISFDSDADVYLIDHAEPDLV